MREVNLKNKRDMGIIEAIAIIGFVSFIIGVCFTFGQASVGFALGY